MSFLIDGFKYVSSNIELMAAAALALLAFAEIVVRFTPTKKDDGFVERAGQKIRYILDVLKVPNTKKKEKSPEVKEIKK